MSIKVGNCHVFKLQGLDKRTSKNSFFSSYEALWQNISMIELTTLSGKIFFLNPDLIRTIEQAPDTIICMTDGTRLPVKDSVQNIREKIIQFRRSIYSTESEREF